MTLVKCIVVECVWNQMNRCTHPELELVPFQEGEFYSVYCTCINRSDKVQVHNPVYREMIEQGLV